MTSYFSDIEKATLSWNRYHANNNSIVFDLFGGQLESTVFIRLIKIRCCSCNYRSTTFETFWDLSVPIPTLNNKKKSCDINECLLKFSEEEILDGHEKYNCPRCKSQQKATKMFRIYRYPDILILHIKRFMQNKKGGREKITIKITYPEFNFSLDTIRSNLEGSDNCSSYSLIAVCHHIGKNLIFKTRWNEGWSLCCNYKKSRR
jgi:ubiquitin carboxyl-terminal hydrolase 2/21